MKSITSVYFQYFNEKILELINNKFQNFPKMMETELKIENVQLIEPPLASEE